MTTALESKAERTPRIMADRLSNLLSQAAASIVEPTAEQNRLIDELSELGNRLVAQQLRIAVLGQFKRGKSSLLNALLGMQALPMGITPITAIPTFVRSASRHSIQVKRQGAWEEPTVDGEEELSAALKRFVSEAGNPKNRLDVQEVHVGAPSVFPMDSVIFIDTPGVGSTFEHNTRAAEAVLAKCDAALFVVSADPPITEAELSYLGQIRALIPRLVFVLNKADLLSAEERTLARDFLVHVLSEQANIPPPIEVYLVSAREALTAEEANDGRALTQSGLPALRSLIADILAREKQGILIDVIMRRARATIERLRFQTELRLKGFLLPLEELQSKVATFEQSAAEFEEQRRALADSMFLDKQRLLRELDSDTDRLWKAARADACEKLEKFVGMTSDPAALRERLKNVISDYFDSALDEFTVSMKVRICERLSVHQRRADSLIEAVSRCAAELMEISIPRSEPKEAFRADREPYWVAPERLQSLASLSIAPFSRFIPKKISEERARRQQAAELDRAVLRNVSHLDWAMRQNIEEAFRRFEIASREELGHALDATRAAMQVALDRHRLHEDAISRYVREASDSIEALDQILQELGKAVYEKPDSNPH
jgi:hypothetical protein